MRKPAFTACFWSPPHRDLGHREGRVAADLEGGVSKLELEGGLFDRQDALP